MRQAHDVVAERHPGGIDEKLLEGGRRGWPVILSGLKSLLETGKSLPAFDMSEMDRAVEEMKNSIKR